MIRILQGDCRALLRGLPADSVHCVVTSPPYWGLRDYGVEGQLGLEETPQEFVDTMVEVFREVRRVLRPDGTLWLNLGDSYIDAGGAGGQGAGERAGRRHTQPSLGIKKRITASKLEGHTGTQAQALRADEARRYAPDLKPKDLAGIPWRVAFALQADGWYLRSDIIWHKPNPMPESVEDRPTKAHEYLFLLTKEPRYFYDAKAIQEPLALGSAERYEYAFGGSKAEALVEANMTGIGGRTRPVGERKTPTGRNRRTVWTVPSRPFHGAHFATFPPDLIEPCIKAGCPEGGLVLDPFGGAGTTGLVADRLGRHAILLELNPAYIEIAAARLRDDAGLLSALEIVPAGKESA